MDKTPAEEFALLSEAFEALEASADRMMAATADQWPEHSRMERASFMLRSALYKMRTELEARETKELDPVFIASGGRLFVGLPHERASMRRMARVYQDCDRYPLEPLDETSP